jgi:hypothetical protein
MFRIRFPEKKKRLKTHLASFLYLLLGKAASVGENEKEKKRKEC